MSVNVLKINFTHPTESVPVNNQKEMNSYIHRCIGNGNPYHDSFSDYAISSLQGGKLDKGTDMLVFEGNPYILMTLNNIGFGKDFVNGLLFKKETVFGMRYNGYELVEMKTHREYDIVTTVSPILLKVRGCDGVDKKVTIRDDGYIDMLKEHCVRKLKNNGIVDGTFDLVVRNPEKAKQKLIWVGDVFNPCTNISMYVYGKRETREKLYNLGFGNSTGSGFGFVKVY